jgi:hypothetical protein
MAIKRCPYCRAIIDERDQYCNNCGTQLLFPEDELVEEDIPGEKIIDVDEAPPAEESGEISVEEPRPQPPPPTKAGTSFVFPETLGDLGLTPEEKKERKSKKAKTREGLLDLSVEREAPPAQEASPPAERTSAEMGFDEVFPGKTPHPDTKENAELPPIELEPIIQPVQPRAKTRTGTRDEPSLGASDEEAEDIARMMSSLDEKAAEPPQPPAAEAKPADQKARTGSAGHTPFFEKEIDALRDETLRGASRDKKAESGALKKSAADVPPWVTGLHIEPPPIERYDLPREEAGREVPPLEPASGLTEILNKLEEEPAPPTDYREEEEPAPGSDSFESEEAPSSDSWGNIPDSTEISLDSLSDRLGREREATRRRARRRAGGSRIKAKVYDVLIVALCWAVAVWLASRILGASVMEMFSVAAVPLLLFLVTLGAAYFLLFLYFLGETLGDRLASS